MVRFYLRFFPINNRVAYNRTLADYGNYIKWNSLNLIYPV